MPDNTNAIAVVGMSGRFAGAPDAESLWTLMMERGESVRPVPADRWDTGRVLDPGKDVQAVGGFLDGVDQFDAGFFGISPREAADMDPQQRLLLETAWRAVEDAGQRPADLAGSRTGVYVGASWHDYELLRKERGTAPSQHGIVGGALDVLASRISYFLRLRGPSLTVESGCSSSLVALHLAVQALRQGEIGAAVVGAANLILTPDTSVGLTHFGALSPDGRCSAFAASANGFVRAEGVAAVCLKTLDRALADGDRIHGVVLRTAVNNDGGGDSLVTPDTHAQEELLRDVYGDGPGAVPADSVSYIEAHGTGTGRGDPAEATAIGRAVGRHRTSGPLPIGSVKTNVGHLEAAAGMGGLFKVLLALRHRVVPPSLHAETLNPGIPFDDLNVRVLREPLELPRTGPVRLGVSSFGWGGTNAHAVVAAPPEPARPAGTEVAAPTAAPPAGDGHRPPTGLPVLVPLSAQSPSVLAERAAQLREHAPRTEKDVEELAGTLAWRRGHLPVRAALLATTPDALSRALTEVSERPEDAGDAGDRNVVTGTAVARGRTAFVFPGQGSQWSGMGQDLYRDSPLFADVVDRCVEALRPHLAWDPLDVFTGKSGDAWLERVDAVQPVLWAMSLGLAELWRASGVTPDVVVGHSQGEIAAATLAGILSYEDGALVVARRSAIVRRTCGRGRMLAVDLDRDAALAAVAPLGGRVALAAHNGPTSCVLSGDTDAVLALKDTMEADGTYCRLVQVDYASHSPQMADLREDLMTALAPAAPGPGTLELFSTVRGELLDGGAMDAAYWVENLCGSVLFADSVTRCLGNDVSHLVEISPHPVLTPAVEQLVAEHGRPAAALATLRRGEGGPDAFARALARGYAAGLEPFGGLPRCSPVPLPAHPLRPERHWLPDGTAPSRSGAVQGLDVALAPSPGERDVWHGTTDIAVGDLPWLADHRVHGTAVLPGTATLALALNTARARTGSLPRALHDITLSAAVAFGEGPEQLAVEWRDDIGEGGSFRLLSLPEGGDAWTEHATARADYRGVAEDVPGFPAWLDAARAEEPGPFYEACARRGLGYGPAFRCLRSLYQGPDHGSAYESAHESDRGPGRREAVGEAVLDGALLPGARRHLLHPALWDGALQVSLAVFGQGGSGDAGDAVGTAGTSGASDTAAVADTALVPVAVRRIRVPERPDAAPVDRVWSHAVRHPDDTVDVRVFDGERRLVLAVEGLRLAPLAGNAGDGAVDAARLHQMRWTDVTGADRAPDAPAGRGRWAVCGDPGGLAESLADALAASGAEVTRVPAPKPKQTGAPAPASATPPSPSPSTASASAPAPAPAPSGLTGAAGVVFVAPPAAAGLTAQRQGLDALTGLVRACADEADAPRLAVVTPLAQAAATGDRPDPGAALYWGYARVLRREHGELEPRVVDVDPADEGWAAACAAEVLGADREDQVALRGGKRLAARLTHVGALGDAASGDAAGFGDGESRSTRRPPLRPARLPFRIASTRPGLWEGVTSLPSAGVPPGPGEIEVEVSAAALNFIDVMKALGTYPDPAGGARLLGGECAGRVVTVGPGVTGHRLGDRVVACAFGSLASHVTVRAEHALPVPAGLGDADAAALPLAMATAWYGLAELARLERDETVLIHSAAGGVGLAAVQVARLLGARVVATAGSEAKRRRLRSLGVIDVFDSRDLGWVAAVRAATGGRGVDVVLNSLTGAAIEAGLDVLAEDGRFVELGKKDIHGGRRLSLDAFRKGVSFAAVDLAGLMERRPRRFARMFADVWEHVTAGRLTPLPVRTHPFTEAATALREMSRGEHIGKFALVDPGSVAAVAPVPLPDGRLRADGTYLVTGGLGALGLSLARFLAGRGAGALALLGRSAAAPEAERQLAELRSAGTRVEVLRCDVGDERALGAALERVRREMPPLRGVFHAAGVLADATIDTLTPSGTAGVVAPKAVGARNLDALTADDPLDLFVLFSSAAALVGNVGQAAYAAANAYLDALAESRRARGLPALSVQWGPFSDIGLAAADERRGARLTERGMGGFPAHEAWSALARMLEHDEPVVGYLPLDLERWFDAYPDTAALPSWQSLRAAVGGGAAAAPGSGLRARLLAADPDARAGVGEAAVRELAGRVLRLPPERVGMETPFKALGLDSLMSLELRNRLEAAFGTAISPTLLWTHGTVRALSGALVGELTAAPAPAS
ncbi:SDR family NAD(P)-dependent oxidoreductase [Streptomyces sp. p1417]|uniref:SDR family NAD(P)-dependent oxidoreductase n=1 Tax=Streptomyces typhae TaxID=2681492 RepID=A0A6L6X4V0_9ACTN|nr:type I polyketide synthase [Streptomyces typhae]MVO88579.1 SDR family NAD(P)-dependent oxidoreductase [Streptomyces typhae]